MAVEPNEKQGELIESTEGIYLVDAGAGTGKTFTVTRRYAHILDNRDVEPKDILLVTFTNNAAEEMRDKILDRSSYDLSSLREAPICTFHSYCKGVVESHGFNAPKLLGIDENIPGSTRIRENEFLEMNDFDRFIDQFIQRHSEYRDFFRIVYDRSDLLHLIKSLAVKGIIPKEDGWFRKGEEYLDGNYKEFLELFNKVNRPRNDGRKQSELRAGIGFRNCCMEPGAPDKEEVRGPRGSKKVNEKYARKAFKEDREELKEFVHDLYYEYLEYCLGKNYLNFAFWMLFAFVILCERDGVREKLSFEYVMVDEFQDTNEIQLKLALLLSKKDNICAVGDWKQSIYSFQYASVDNIRKFRERLKKYKEELNDNKKRVDYSVEKIQEIHLTQNYRSGQEILDFSEQSFRLKARRREILDETVVKDVVSLESEQDFKGEISAFTSKEEKKAVLERIEKIVDNEDYKVPGKDGMRKVRYSDIAVLSRSRKFGLELQEMARRFGVPAAFEGGVELFKTDPAIILLAWFRILDYKDSRRGWSVILEEAGYSLDEADKILEDKEYPEEMVGFREKLEGINRVSVVARKVFEKYGINNAFSSKIIEVLDRTFRKTYMSMGDLIRFIEDCIEGKETYEVDASRGENLVTIQTIHAAKGLEYPVVFISDINEGRFPGRGRGGGRIVYEDPIGLRQKKVYIKDEMPYCYDNWEAYLLTRCIPGEYDEERRLMYVAMTRAKRYLFFSAHPEKKSGFFRGLDIEKENVDPKLEVNEKETIDKRDFVVEEPEERSPVKIPVTSITEVKSKGRGKEFGKEVHRFAERYTGGEDVEPENRDEENVASFLDSLDGKKVVEESCILPLEVDGRKMVLTGKIDLLHIKDEEVELVDYKTSEEGEYKEEHRKQLSAYYHVLKKVYPEREIRMYVFYTAEDDIVEITPLELGRIKKEIRPSN